MIAAEIIDSGRRPPKAERVAILAELLATIQIVRLEQRLGVFKLFVGVITGFVELGYLGIQRFYRSLCFLGCCR
jgi:hypothetical protein